MHECGNQLEHEGAVPDSPGRGWCAAQFLNDAMLSLFLCNPCSYDLAGYSQVNYCLKQSCVSLL